MTFLSFFSHLCVNTTQLFFFEDKLAIEGIMFIKECTTEYLLYILEGEQPPKKLLEEIKQSSLYQSFSIAEKEYLLAVNEGIIGASISIDFFWAMIYIGEFSLVTMSSFLGILALISLGLGAGITWKTYQKSIKEQKELNKKLETAFCKEVIYAELLIRQQLKLQMTQNLLRNKLFSLEIEENQLEDLTHSLKQYGIKFSDLNNDVTLLEIVTNKQLREDIFRILVGDNKIIKQTKHYLKQPLFAENKVINYKSKAIKAMISGIGLNSILFGSFYVGSIYIFLGLGLSTAAMMLSNPISIAIALTTLTIVGIVYGYQIYQKSKKISEKNKIIEDKNKKIELTRFQYEDAKKLTRSTQKMLDRLFNYPCTYKTQQTFFQTKPQIRIFEENLAENNHLSFN